MMNRPERLHILGAPVDVVDMPSALEFIDRQISEGDRPGVVLAMNPEKVYALRTDPFLMKFFEGAALLIPDGIGVVVGMRLLYGKKVRRVPGADLMQTLCALSSRNGYRLFLYGSSEEVNKGAVEELEKRYPGIRIVGRANGYLPPEEMDGLIARINASGADILFVALGSPRQEKWMEEYLPRLNVKIAQGIGGTLDTITGRVKRAPKFFQALGLEWFYRLLSQPSRITRQKALPRFAWELLCTKFNFQQRTGR
jgi:N-acetylglucosaminyldiphosphoundecaprenol N-acetyl-beta-D-mannosaminyltransferase